MIAARSGFTIHAAAGVFIQAGGLIALTGLFRALDDLVVRCPEDIAPGPAGGRPFALCAAPRGALQTSAFSALPMIAVFGPVRLRHTSFAVPAALGPGLLPGLWGVPVGAAGFTTPAPMIIRPVFDMGARIGPGVLLHLVTMA
ncbi:MAG: benzoate/H(+) symporter BenE family transporter, partial [Rhodobacter sp.]|nr:benzoate/H(+) symporter BenE family transporter [Rhodobacter sp.]